jgi:hypothetical protein
MTASGRVEPSDCGPANSRNRRRKRSSVHRKCQHCALLPETGRGAFLENHKATVRRKKAGRKALGQRSQYTFANTIAIGRRGRNGQRQREAETEPAMIQRRNSLTLSASAIVWPNASRAMSLTVPPSCPRGDRNSVALNVSSR